MNLRIKNIDIAILFLLLFIYCILQINLLFTSPIVWPDEAYIADVARNLLQEGRAGTDLWGDTIVGIRKSLYWHPPFFISTLALWFGIFDPSIINQRMLSIILGGGLIIIVYFLSQKILTKVSLKRRELLGLCLISFLIFDMGFLKSSKIGRPEAMVALLGFFALYIYQFIEEKESKFYYLGLGFITGLAGLAHLIGNIFFLIILIQVLIDKKLNKLLFLIIGFALPLLFWIVSILPDYDIFIEQFSLQQSFRNLVPSYIESVFNLYTGELKIIYLLYLILSLVCIIYFLKKRLFRYSFLFLGLLISWLICFVGKLEWYSIYIVSFLYPSSFVIIANISKKYLPILLVLLISLFLINLKVYFNSAITYQDKRDDYYLFGQEVKSKIPEKSSIYLSTTPDLYFLLAGRNPLFEFPGVKPKEDEYLNLLNNSDYIVINFHLERLFLGNFLDEYIKQNSSRSFQIGNNNLYNALIIELIPRNMRKLSR